MTPPTDLFTEVTAAYEAYRSERPFVGEFAYLMDTATQTGFIAGARWALEREVSKLERKLEDAEQTVQERLHASESNSN